MPPLAERYYWHLHTKRSEDALERFLAAHPDLSAATLVDVLLVVVELTGEPLHHDVEFVVEGVRRGRGGDEEGGQAEQGGEESEFPHGDHPLFGGRRRRTSSSGWFIFPRDTVPDSRSELDDDA